MATPLSGIERALIAKGMGGSEVILATDGPQLWFWVHSCTDRNEEIGLPDLDGLEPGVYLFTGQLKRSFIGLEQEPDDEWDGTVRPVKPEELAELLTMEPPAGDECSLCGSCLVAGESGICMGCADHEGSK